MELEFLKCSKCGNDIMEEKMKIGEEVEGICPNCFGRGRKQHLEYTGEDEVICMVCSSIIKLKENSI